MSKCESPAFPQGFAGLLPGYAGSKNFWARVVIDLAAERERRKRTDSFGLRPPRILELLAQAEEFQRLLDTGADVDAVCLRQAVRSCMRP